MTKALVWFLSLWIWGHSAFAQDQPNDGSDGERQSSEPPAIEIVVQSAHVQQFMDVIADLAFSPDNRFLASMGKDQAVKIWDVNNGYLLRTFSGHQLPGQTDASMNGRVTFSPDGLHAMSWGNLAGTHWTPSGAGYTYGYLVWRLDNGRIIRTIPGYQPAFFTADSRSVLMAEGKGLWAFDLTGGAPRLLLEPGGDADRHQFILTGNRVLYVSDDRLTVLEGSSGNVLTDIDAETSNHERFALSGDGARIAGVDQQGRVTVYSASSGAILSDFNAPGRLWRASPAFAPDNQTLWMMGQGWSGLWNVADGSEVQLFNRTPPTNPCPQALRPAHNKAFTFCGSYSEFLDLDISPQPITTSYYRSGDKPWALSDDGQLFAWYELDAIRILRTEHMAALGDQLQNYDSWYYEDRAAGRYLRTINAQSLAIDSLAFSADGRYLATAPAMDGVALWDLRTGTDFRVYQDQFGRGTVGFSPDSTVLYLVQQNTMEGWALADDEAVWIHPRIEIANGYDRGFAITPDGTGIGVSHGQIAHLYDFETGRQRASIAMNGFPQGKALSQNGRWYAAGAHSQIGLADLETPGAPVFRSLDTNLPVTSIAFDPASERMLTVSGAEVTVWSLPGLDMLITLETDMAVGRQHAVFAQNGQSIVIASRSANLQVLDANSGAMIRELAGHTAAITALAVHPNGRLLASASADGTVRLWDLERGTTSAILVVSPNGGFVMATPDGYYVTSKDRPGGVGFRQGLRVFPFEQFDLTFNRPDIVLDRVGLATPGLIDAYRRAHNKRLQKLGFPTTNRGAGLSAPEVAITTGLPPVSTDDPVLNTTFRFTDPGGVPLDRMNLWVNGVPLPDRKGTDLAQYESATLNVESKIPLAPGRNHIQVSAHNIDGAESLRETFVVNRTGPEPKPVLYLLTVGVSEYKDSDFNLSYAAKDARDVIDLFVQASDLYADVKLLRLLNDQVTLENVTQARDFLMQAGLNDHVVVFFAGHGLLDQNLDYFLASADVDFAHPARRGIPFEAIDSLVDGLTARKRLIMIDACHSGEIDSDQGIGVLTTSEIEDGRVVARGFKTKTQARQQNFGLKDSFGVMKSLFAELRRGSGAAIIASAAGSEFAFETDALSNGVFTYAVREGLTKGLADQDGDGQIRVSEIRDYVAMRVRALTNGRQTPTARRENLALNFFVY